jgi:myo-inositol 2-dehydrogenase/D-chiro-inositol 1-dehydrogenase
MTEPLIRYGIVGCGSMGREHIENIRALGDARVTALADPHAPSRAAALAQLDAPVPAFDNCRTCSTAACATRW